MHHRLTRSLTAAALSLTGLVPVLASTSAPASAATPGQAAANAAMGQRYYAESGGYDCNKFSAYWKSGSGPCSGNGNLSEPWCSDFAAWAWRQAGIPFTYSPNNAPGDLGPAAVTFYNYGVAHKTWHPYPGSYVPQPGDAAVYGVGQDPAGAAHVGLVVSANGNGAPNVINGNFGSIVDYEASEATNGGKDPKGLSGYASPDLSGLVPTTPAAPSNLSVGTVTASTVPLRWSAPDSKPTPSSYAVYKNGTLVTTTSGTSSTVTGLSASTAYTFTVKSIATTNGTSYYSEASNPLRVTTAPASTPPPTGAELGTRVAAVYPSNGTEALFSTDRLGNLYITNQTSAGATAPYTGWQQISSSGNLLGSTPTAVIAPNGTVATFERTRGGQIESIGQTSTTSGFVDWGTIGSGGPSAFASDPSVQVMPNGTVAVTATDASGGLWESNQYSAGSTFTPWTRIDTVSKGTPSSIVAPNGTLSTYERNTNGQIQSVGQSSPGSGFVSWGVIGTGGPATFASDPSAVLVGNGTIAVFAVDTSHTLWETNQSGPGGTFVGWTPIGNGFQGVPSSVFVSGNSTVATYERTTGGRIASVGQSSSGSGFVGWGEVGSGGPPSFSSDPTATYTPDGRVDLVATGSDGYRYHAYQPSVGSGFTAWTALQ